MNNPKQIIENFKAGKIGVFPTDTAYGVGCRIDDIESVKKVFQIRNRPYEKALIILVGSVEMAKDYVFIDDDSDSKLVKRYWPGGLSIIFRCKKEKVPGIVRANGETVAVRFPNHSELVDIINKIGVPIVAPSANFSGDATPIKLSEVSKKLLDKVDFTLNGVCTIEGVSTIIDTTQKPWKVLREGVVKLDGYA